MTKFQFFMYCHSYKIIYTLAALLVLIGIIGAMGEQSACTTCLQMAAGLG